mgnify:CR=1 FL=1
MAEELLGFLEGAELVIHNAAFDIAFLDAELAEGLASGEVDVARAERGLVLLD